MSVCLRACSSGSVVSLCDPMNCSLPGSSVHGDSPGKNTRVGCHFLFQGTFPTHGLNPQVLHLWHWQMGFPPLSYVGSLSGCLLLLLLLSRFSHVQLFVTPWTIAHQAPLFMGILQERILEWAAMPSSRGSSQPGQYFAGGFFTD